MGLLGDIVTGAFKIGKNIWAKGKAKKAAKKAAKLAKNTAGTPLGGTGLGVVGVVSGIMQNAAAEVASTAGSEIGSLAHGAIVAGAGQPDTKFGAGVQSGFLKAFWEKNKGVVITLGLSVIGGLLLFLGFRGKKRYRR